MDTIRPKVAPEDMLISYMLLRKFIGIIGIMLPIVLLLGCCIHCEMCRQESISGYYHSNMRDFFVGILFSIGVFMFCYRGYHAHDHFASIWSGVSVLCVALFPTDMDAQPLSTSGIIHYVSAISFFTSLVYFCLVLFTRTSGEEPPTEMKLMRNTIYRFCGYVIIICMITILLYKLWLSGAFPVLSQFDPVFWFETFALWAFGFSWLIKGEVMFRD